MDELQKGEILIYQSEGGDTKIDVFLEDGTVWLLQASIARLYQTMPQNIIMHTRKIFSDGELDETATYLHLLHSIIPREKSRILVRQTCRSESRFFASIYLKFPPYTPLPSSMIAHSAVGSSYQIGGRISSIECDISLLYCIAYAILRISICNNFSARRPNCGVSRIC